MHDGRWGCQVAGSEYVPERAVPPVTMTVHLPRIYRVTVWIAIGLTGLVVNTGLLWFLADRVGVHYLVAAIVATQASSTWNFALVDSLVYRGTKKHTWWRRLAGFLIAGNVALLLRVPLLAVLVSGLGLHYLMANVVTLVLTFLGRFAIQEKLSMPEDPT